MRSCTDSDIGSSIFPTSFSGGVGGNLTVDHLVRCRPDYGNYQDHHAQTRESFNVNAFFNITNSSNKSHPSMVETSNGASAYSTTISWL